MIKKQYAVFTNAKYPELFGHSVNVLKSIGDRVSVVFLTGKALGVVFMCGANEIGEIPPPKRQNRTALDYFIHSHHQSLVA